MDLGAKMTKNTKLKDLRGKTLGFGKQLKTMESVDLVLLKHLYGRGYVGL